MQGICVIMVLGLPLTVLSQLEIFAGEISPVNVVAQGSQGTMIGTILPEGGTFHGIPYTQPPTGEYRWKKPRDPVPFPNDVWDATYFRPQCIQPCSEESCRMSEDCLHLNIWVPNSVLEESDESNDVTKGKHYVISKQYQQKDDNSLAVMVYIHGGAFNSGAGSLPLYDGRFLASKGNVIVVTINYRVGAMGFLVQEGGAAAGNYGMRDQIAALKWVQNEIANFGGNPNKVTIFGESAGGEAVATLMAIEEAEGLFHGGIMESDPFGLPYRDTANAENFGADFARILGCKSGDMKCLRGKTPEEVLETMKNMPNAFSGGLKTLAFQPWSPVIDGDFLKELPIHAFANGRAMRIPSIIGATADDGLLFISFVFNEPVGALLYKMAIGVLFPDHAADIEKVYPSEDDNRYTMGRITTDFLFTCAGRAAASGAIPQTWVYLFNQTMPMTISDLCVDKVCHGAELPFVFDTFELLGLHATEAEKELATRVRNYWTNFAKYGNPNGPTESKSVVGGSNAVFWPEFSSDHGTYKEIKFEGSGDIILTDYQKDICEFWDGLALYGLV